MGDSKIINQQIASDLRRIRIKQRQQAEQKAKEDRNTKPATIPAR